jgi:hypothetical protein
MDVYIPPSFSYFVKRLSGVSTSTVRMTNLSQTTASAGDTIKVKFPSNAIVNLSSFTMYSLGTTTETGCFPKLSQSLIQQCRVSIGGQLISGGNCQEVGVLYSIGSRLQTSEAQQRMLHLQHLGKDCVSAGASTVPVVIDDWPFFLSATPRYIHTGILPEMVVDIVLAPNSVLGGANNTYSLANIYFTIEVIQFDNDLYSNILQTRLVNGDTIEIPFLDAHYIIKPASNIIETQVSANAITKLFVVPRVTGWGTLGDPENGLTKPFIFDADIAHRGSGPTTNDTAMISNAVSAYWSIDNKMYPQTPASVPELYQMTLDAFGDRASTLSANSLLLTPMFDLPSAPLVSGQTTHFCVAKEVANDASSHVATFQYGGVVDISPFMVNKYISPADNYLSRNCIFCLNLEVNEGADQRLISGYSSVGKNAVIRFDGSNLLPATVDLTMFCLVKRCLKVRAGQQIFLEM